MPSGESPGYGARLLAGGAAGSLAIALVNPAEVAKTQLQADRGPARRSLVGAAVSRRSIPP